MPLIRAACVEVGPALFFSRFLWVLGFSAVTQHDAVISVRAGFCGHELRALWPEKAGWTLVIIKPWEAAPGIGTLLLNHW